MGYVFGGCKVTYSPSCDLGIVMNVTMDDKNIPVWYHGIFSDSKDNEKLLAIYSTARLIAAAPELYEALEAAYLVLTSQKTRLEEYADAVALARAALAKARADEGKENA